MKNPDPKAWPRCSRCKVDYVLRRAVVGEPGRNGLRSLTFACKWVWQRDCKHRAPAEVARALGKRDRR